jgi:hypothetical protein
MGNQKEKPLTDDRIRSREAKADMAWWQKVGAVLDLRLRGWTARDSASFDYKSPASSGLRTLTIDGEIGRRILEIGDRSVAKTTFMGEPRIDASEMGP